MTDAARSWKVAIYRQNIRRWEQWTRVIAGVALLGTALVVPSVAAKVALVAVGASAVVTGFFGWCPACAAVGRRLDEKADHAPR